MDFRLEIKVEDKKLERYKKQTGLGYSEIFRRALDEYLKKHLEEEGLSANSKP